MLWEVLVLVLGTGLAQTCGVGQEFVLLSNSVEMPRVGFGLAGMRGAATERSVEEHTSQGFALLDGAEATEWYDDEAAGRAVARLPNRTALFLTSKIHPANLHSVPESVTRMLQRWNNTSYMDLVLLHYPGCGSWIPHCRGKVGGDWKSAYRALEHLYDQGVIRALGVSNFNLKQLQTLYEMVPTKLHVVQDWMDPFHQQGELLEWAAKRNIAVTAYSSFGAQWEGQIGKNLVLESHVLRDIATKRQVPITSVVLAWLIVRKNVAVIPRSTDSGHIATNAKFLQPGYARSLLTEEDMDRIDLLDDLYDVGTREQCQGAAPPSKLCDTKCRATCSGKDW
ncbi:hypothetical protein BASA81_003534 [Batrachochytrium salamandrivorans]|nr:hypothetical protein BASA81_003534 [Batrachochytrium salamandrivorans]